MEEVRKLHLGCFDQVFPGWINTDITPHIWISRIPGLPMLLFKLGLLSKQRLEQHKRGIFRAVKYLNCVRRFPYSDNTFDYVYMSHLLEHLYPQGAIFCLREVYRVLKPGGIVRIAVPDLDRMVANYDPHNPDAFLEAIFEAKQKRDKNRHHWHYNEVSLTRLLKQVGFQEVYRCEYKKGFCADVEMIDNRPDSLFIEARKGHKT